MKVTSKKAILLKYEFTYACQLLLNKTIEQEGANIFKDTIEEIFSELTELKITLIYCRTLMKNSQNIKLGGILKEK